MLLVKMDPVSAVLGVVSGSATLAATALRTVQYLTSLKDIYDRSGIIILDLLAACEAFEAAWDRIHSWSNCHRALPTGPERPDPIFNHILSFLEIGKVVLGSLQADLERFKSEIEDKGKSNGNIKNPLRKRDKTRVVLRDKTFRGHREIISNQVNSLNLLLSTAMLLARFLGYLSIHHADMLAGPTQRPKTLCGTFSNQFFAKTTKQHGQLFKPAYRHDFLYRRCSRKIQLQTKKLRF